MLHTIIYSAKEHYTPSPPSTASEKLTVSKATYGGSLNVSPLPAPGGLRATAATEVSPKRASPGKWWPMCTMLRGHSTARQPFGPLQDVLQHRVSLCLT